MTLSQVEHLPFLEVTPEHFLGAPEPLLARLDRVVENFTVLSHGSSLSLAASEPQSGSHLASLKREILRINAPWHSDHLSFSTIGALKLHEFLPPPLTEVSAQLVAYRMRRIQDYLGIPFAAENIAIYGHFVPPEMGELDWILSVLELSGGKLVLDLNSIYVNSANFGFDAENFVRQLPADRICQLHVSGHERIPEGTTLVSRGTPVATPVLKLLEQTLLRTGPLPVTLERDRNIPKLDLLLTEVESLQKLYNRTMSEYHRQTLSEAAS